RHAVCFLSLAYRRRANLSQFSMGHFAARDRLPGDLFRAMAPLDEKKSAAAGVSDPGRSACFARRPVFAQGASLQLDGDVRRGETHQRRCLLLEHDGTRTSFMVDYVSTVI